MSLLYWSDFWGSLQTNVMKKTITHLQCSQIYLINNSAASYGVSSVLSDNTHQDAGNLPQERLKPHQGLALFINLFFKLSIVATDNPVDFDINETSTP